MLCFFYLKGTEETCSLKHQPRAMLNLVSALLLLFLSCFTSPHQACNQLDRDSLLSFFLNTSSPPLNWSSSKDCCFWEGIHCNIDGQVTHLWLPLRGLSGIISPSLGNLMHLSHLNLSHNRLSGPLPNEIFSSLILLETLDLSYNHLSGQLPSSLPSSHVKMIDLSSNQFSGAISPSFYQLAGNLTSFNVSNNSFTGPIPSFICINYSRSVRFLDFSYNDFSGHIFAGLGECSKLQNFRAGSNNLSGPLPEDIYDAAALQEVSLPLNHLSGTIGDGIIHLTNLTILELYSNQLSGSIPRDIGKLSKLEHLLLHINNLNGSLPPSLMNCTNLKILNLRVNLLGGDLSAFNFSSFLQLRTLDLGNNNFTGGLPLSLYSCKSLTAVRLASNQLEGQILPDILALQSLSFLSLSNNSLTNITGAIRILTGCKNLTTVILSENFIYEEIPNDDDIVFSDGFQNLQVLAFGGSQLTGQVPAWLAKLKKLEVLDLSTNQITGSIPGWLGSLPHLFFIDLSNNLISGKLPEALFGLPALTSEQADNQGYLELPVFAMPNHIPNQQYNQLSHLPPAIYLHNNSLNGNIPVQIGQLKFLHVLELGNNNFSGNIPDQMSDLHNLERLDLSGNDLSGEIPASLRDLNFLSYFSVANNNLEGSIPSGGQFDTFPGTSFEGNPGLCGSIVQRSCDKPPGTTLPTKASKSSNNELVFGLLAGAVFGFIIGSAGGLLYPICRLKRLQQYLFAFK